MFARITPFKMKADHREAGTRLLTSMKSDIMGLPGMRHFTHAMDSTGKGYVVSLIETRDDSEAGRARIAALWKRFDAHLESRGDPETFEVFADWERVAA